MRGSALVQSLEYADDAVLVSDSMDSLEEVLRSLDAICSGVGLSISFKKTKILAVCPSTTLGSQPRPVHLKQDEEPVAVVDKFKYLGSIITEDYTLYLFAVLQMSK